MTRGKGFVRPLPLRLLFVALGVGPVIANLSKTNIPYFSRTIPVKKMPGPFSTSSFFWSEHMTSSSEDYRHDQRQVPKPAARMSGRQPDVTLGLSFRQRGGEAVGQGRREVSSFHSTFFHSTILTQRGLFLCVWFHNTPPAITSDRQRPRLPFWLPHPKR